MRNLLYFVLFVFVSTAVFATTSNYTTFVDGNVLNASDLNSLQTHYSNADNAILNGDTFTGDMIWHSGADANFFSDTGTTLKAKIDGATGTIIGAPKGIGTFNNLNIEPDTVTQANDAIRIECGNSACSATNPGFVTMLSPSPSPGDVAVFSVTEDVIIELTGADWQYNTRGDVNDAILRVFAVNDNGSLRWCVGLLGGRETLLSTDDKTAQNTVTLAEYVLCNSSVTSATNSVQEFGWVRANFDDTGGAAENLWAVQQGSGDIGYGSADGLWQDFDPVFTGFSANPSVTIAKWTQVGRIIHVRFLTVAGTSNATTTTITFPADAGTTIQSVSLAVNVDNSASKTTPSRLDTRTDSSTFDLYSDSAGGNWTSSGTKNASGNFFYEVGPAASFIP
jgi:hypothetical protein